MGDIVGFVASPETEAYRDSFVNWLRFKHRGFVELGTVILTLGVLIAASYGILGLTHLLFPVHQFTACGTIGCNHTTGTLPNTPAPKGFPVYKP